MFFNPVFLPYLFLIPDLENHCGNVFFIFLSVTAKTTRTLEDINRARVKVKNEIIDLRDKLQIAKDTISKFKNEIVKAQTAAIKPA